VGIAARKTSSVSGFGIAIVNALSDNEQHQHRAGFKTLPLRVAIPAWHDQMPSAGCDR
jgi:hypothetical protein